MNTGASEETVANFLFGAGGAGYRVKSSFINTVDGGDLRKVKTFVQLGYEVNEKDSQGKTALMYSIEKGHESVFDYLLEKDADMLAIDDEYKSVTDYVILSRRRRFLHKLITKGLLKTAVGEDQMRKALKLAADKNIEGMREMIVRAFQQARANRGAFRN